MAASPSHPTFRAILHAAFPGSVAAAAAPALDVPGFDDAIDDFVASTERLDAEVVRFTDLARSVQAAAISAERRRLHGRQVAFTGAGRSARDRAQLAATCGFVYGTKVTDDTALLVLGNAEVATSQRTKAVAAAIPVLDETTFWARLGGVA